jgi:hypothetical protein
LELCHIVATQHRSPVIQEPVSELEPGLDQSGPCLRPARPVYAQPSQVLERLYGRPCPGAEDATRIRERVDPERG